MPLTPEDPETVEKGSRPSGPPKRRHELRNKGKKKKKVSDASGYSSTSNFATAGIQSAQGATQFALQ